MTHDLRLWLCDRFHQPVEITRAACAALAKQAAKSKRKEVCHGCKGVVTLCRAAGRSPRELDTSRCTPPAQIPKFHHREGQPQAGRPARHHRNDPFTAAMAARGTL